MSNGRFAGNTLNAMYGSHCGYRSILLNRVNPFCLSRETVCSFRLPYTVTRMHAAVRSEALYLPTLRPSHEVLPSLFFFSFEFFLSFSSISSFLLLLLGCVAARLLLCYSSSSRITIDYTGKFGLLYIDYHKFIYIYIYPSPSDHH